MTARGGPRGPGGDGHGTDGGGDPSEPPPTEPMDAVELEPDPPAGAAAASTPPLDAGPVDDPASALDSLFGEDQFREYDPGIAPRAADPFLRSAERAVPASPSRKPPPDTPLRGTSPGAAVAAPAGSVAFARLSHTQKILLGILAGLLALLATVALFFVGMRVSSTAGSAQASTPPTPSASAAGTPAFVAGPISPGRHAWADLRGGECLTSYDSAWARTFTVADCGTPHDAQLVFRGVFETADGGYPGADVLALEVVRACTAAGGVDLAKARVITDAQIAGSYPATAEEWKNGARSYFCFVDRAGDEPLTGSIAVPQRKAPVPYLVGPTPTPTPTP